MLHAKRYFKNYTTVQFPDNGIIFATCKHEMSSDRFLPSPFAFSAGTTVAILLGTSVSLSAKHSLAHSKQQQLSK